ncbi:MAG: hypothetical protein WDN66_00995 [Candidatus Saccharibacteria bacterium]
MALLRKKQPKLRETGAPPRRNIRSYSYHNVRNEQDLTLGRNIKQASVKTVHSARKLWLEKFGLIILAVAVIISLISILYLSNTPNVILQGNSNDPVFSDYKSSVQSTATKLLASSILNSNKITVDTRKVQSVLQTDYPMYSSVSITLPLIDHHAVISLIPAQPAVTLTDTAGSYLLNENGQVMERNSSMTAYIKLKLPTVAYNSGQYVNIGQKVLTTQEVQFIQTIVYELGVKGDVVTTMSLPQGTSELNVNLLNKPYYVKFNLQDNDGRQQAGSLLATQHYLQTQNTIPSQYIDVRTDGRVYYQ